MKTNRVVFAWNRPLPGREGASGQLFQTFLEYLGAQQRAGHIDSFEPTFLEPRGNTVNGFILISGDPQKLRDPTESAEWVRLQTKAIINLDGVSVVGGVSGALLQERMQTWLEEIPR